ncbi:hypothetical protein N7467_009061 [Penicillium canescens]|nr:hypothetical protein N7467_009061 [Penicillium canescens]
MTNDIEEVLSGNFNSLMLQENPSESGRHTSSRPGPSLKVSPSIQCPLDQLFKRSLQPTLNSQRTLDRIDQSHPFFTKVERICQENKWPEYRFENFRRLMCGVRNFPCILLQNPKNDHLEYNEMIRKTKTLCWIQDTLKEIGLELDDIIIIDLFPLLTDEWLDQHPNERAKYVKDMFQLTLDFIQEFKPPIILSCQCWKPTEKVRWGQFKHNDTEKLRSSMAGAKMQRVSGAYFGAHFTYVVHGFHPAKWGWVRKEERIGLQVTLRQIFHSLFNPCATWQMDYKQALEIKHTDKIHSIKMLIYTLRQRETEYENIREEGLALGMFKNHRGSTSPEAWVALKNALDAIIGDISRNSKEPL